MTEEKPGDLLTKDELLEQLERRGYRFLLVLQSPDKMDDDTSHVKIEVNEGMHVFEAYGFAAYVKAKSEQWMERASKSVPGSGDSAFENNNFEEED